ncbi:MAG: hypothetical protein IPP39_07735 [Chitinophagaceae bacterium]|nr:hypothetical protein [Chitinophagaceae bacterium]
MKQHKSLFFRALLCLLLTATCFLKPAALHAQNSGLTGLWTGSLSSDSNSVRKDQSFEIALTEYKGKVYGYSRSEFIVNDTLYYILKRVKGDITGDTCEVKDDEIISYNFRGKLDKGVKVISTFYRNKVDSTWYLAGKWKTSQTKKFYSVTGKVDLEEEKDLQASKIFPHLEELKLAEDVAFYKEQKQGPVIVKIAKPERFKSEYTDLVIKNEPTQPVIVSAKPSVSEIGTGNKELGITNKPVAAGTPDNNTNSEVVKAESKNVNPVTTKTEIAKTNPDQASIANPSNPIQNPNTPVNKVEPVVVKADSTNTKPVIAKTNPDQASITNPSGPVQNPNTPVNKVEPVVVKAESTNAKPVVTKTEIVKTDPDQASIINPSNPVQNPNTPVNKVEPVIVKAESTNTKPVITKTEIAKTNPNQVNNTNPANPVQNPNTPVNKVEPVIVKAESTNTKPVITKTEIAKTEPNQTNTIKPSNSVQTVSKPVTDKPETALKESNQANPVYPSNPVPARPEAALAIDRRKSDVSQIVYYRADSLELVLYDNGEIDGDTVSVLMNNEFIFTKQGLKASAAKKMIYLPAGSNEDFTITLYAENLGKYPPNTGLLVIHDGEDTYNLRFSADYDKNARILFKRKRE